MAYVCIIPQDKETQESKDRQEQEMQALIQEIRLIEEINQAD